MAKALTLSVRAFAVRGKKLSMIVTKTAVGL